MEDFALTKKFGPKRSRLYVDYEFSITPFYFLNRHCKPAIIEAVKDRIISTEAMITMIVLRLVDKTKGVNRDTKKITATVARIHLEGKSGI